MVRLTVPQRWRIAGLALVALVAARPARAQDAIDRLANRPITAITFEVEQHEDTTPALASLIDFKVGDRLDLDVLHESVHHLFSSQFDGVDVVGTETPAGVALLIRLEPRHPVDSIVYKGDTGLSQGELNRLVTTRFGTRLKNVRPAQVEDVLRATLKSEGFLTADPKAALDATHSPHRASVVVDVRAGAPATVGTVTVNGTFAPLTLEEIKRMTGAETGRPYKPRQINDGLLSVRDKLRGLRRYTADARVEPVEPSADGSTVAVTLVIDEGPIVRWAFDGPLPPGNQADLVPIARESSADTDLLNESDARLESAWKMQGYKDAHVEHASQRDGDDLIITFKIERGQRFIIADLAIAGNQDVSRSDIESVLKVYGLARGEPFIASRIPDGRVRITIDYQQRGYYRADVKARTEAAPGGVDGLVVHYDITEGPKGTVTAIVFTPSTSGVSEAQLKDAMRSKIGKPFINALSIDETNLKDLYADNGFPSASVRVTASEDATDKTLAVEITEGPQIIVGDIRIVGREHMSESDIRSELALKAGEPYGAAARRKSQLNLMSLGVFKNVTIEAEPLATGETRAHVVVTVFEAPLTTISFGGGVEGGRRQRPTATNGIEDFTFVAPRGSFEVTRQNLGGVNRSMDLFARLSLSPANNGQGYGFSEYRFADTYRERRAFQWDADMLVSATLEQGIRTDFEFIRKAANASLQRRLGQGVRVEGRYTIDFTHLLNQNILPENRPLIDREFPNVRLSILSGSVLWDRRNDAIAPSHGSLLTADGEFAARRIGSEVGYAKTLLQGSVYRAITDTRRFVLALRGELGLAHGFPRPVVTTDANGQPVNAIVADVPASQRFYAGGSTTVRGFDLDSLGVPGLIDANGLSTGGNGVVVLNVELRVAVAKLFNHPFGVVGFGDSGQVFKNAADVDLGQLRGAVGFGVRYDSPLGPVRLDYGFKLDRFVVGGKLEPAWAWHLSIGEAF